MTTGNRVGTKAAPPEADRSFDLMLPRPLAWALVVLLAVAAVYFLARNWIGATDNPLDFEMRVAKLHLMLHGIDPYRVKLLNLRHEVPPEIWQPIRHFDPNYLPSALTPMLPYAFPGNSTAVRAWWLTNAAAAVALLAALFRMARRPPDPLVYALVGLLFACGSPLQITLANGQTPIVALACLAWALVAVEARRGVVAGVLLALSMLKYHLVLPAALPLFWRRERRGALVIAAALHLAVHLGWSAWLGRPPHTIVLEVLALNRNLLEIEGYDVMSMARAVCAAIGVGSATPLVAVAAFALLVWLVARPWLTARNSLTDLGWLAVWVTFSLALTYHRTYDYVALVVPLVWVATLRGALVARVLVAGGVAAFFIGTGLIAGWMAPWVDARALRWFLDAAAFHAVLAGVLLLTYRAGRADPVSA